MLFFIDTFVVFVGLFPVAFAVVVSEDDGNWAWFLKNLKKVVSLDRRLTFITDRHHGLVTYIPILFPNSYHSFCLWHLKNNIKTAVSSKSSKRSYVQKLLSDCAYAATNTEFDEAMGELRLVGGDEVDKFLERVPYKHWANVYFQGNRLVMY
ncbi:hypothetical protein IFM89_032167 [Coptis chinensis]|uniref:MULE transposase domain-containing protein n=1 Tax=Coptis chinensis TaxID=261450 RepID=A0A835MBA8_9MAGN|nr:hypothetical protein IFM89_032167 [Coptis chinensis]